MPSVKGAGRPEWSWRRARGLQSNPKEESAGSTHHLAELPAGTAGYPVDLTDTAAVRTLFGDLGDIDHLVFTAGESLLISPLGVLDLGQARRFFELRYFGALTAAQAATPHLRRGGSITLTTGAALPRPRSGWSVAASVLGAVDALTRALAVELAPVRVNAVCPGVVRSPLGTR
jgi:NAD(P)-dependent dehydrogenase (short-subunit alcohol dehydrogenase family)